MLDVQRYEALCCDEWDQFVRESKNGTFQFLRGYMDYHSDRFADHSMLVRDSAGNLLALLPAHARENSLVSHDGLSYGGFITDAHMSTTRMLQVFDASTRYAASVGFDRVVYKAMPYIYHRYPAGEDLYALFRNGATLFRRDLSSAAVPGAGVAVQHRRLRGRARALKAGVSIQRSDRYAEFWQILEWNLATAHRLRAVHSLDEILLLAQRFPDQIRLYCAILDSEVVAGCVVYDTPMTAHAQYTASSDAGRRCGALDLLFTTLLEAEFRTKSYFSFGVSSEDGGRYLNAGLADFKEGYGARAVVHDFYEMRVRCEQFT